MTVRSLYWNGLPGVVGLVWSTEKPHEFTVILEDWTYQDKDGWEREVNGLGVTVVSTASPDRLYEVTVYYEAPLRRPHDHLVEVAAPTLLEAMKRAVQIEPGLGYTGTYADVWSK